MMMMYNMKVATIMAYVTLLSLMIGSSNGQVVVSEVGDAGTFNTCGGTATVAGADWVELQNRGPSSIDISSYTMYDDAGASSTSKYTFPNGTVLPANGFLLLCRTATFSYGIGGTDTITLANPSGTVVSTTGRLTGTGSTTNTIQLRDDGITYSYAPPTPNAVNVFPQAPVAVPVTAPVASPVVSAPVNVLGQVVVNEVGDAGTFNTCGGTATVAGADWVELQNRGPSSIDISSYTMYDDAGASSTSKYTFPSGTVLAANATLLLCRGTGSFSYGIGGTDIITLANPSGTVVSTTGRLTGFGSPTTTIQLRDNGIEYCYAPATPNAVNVFPPPDIVVNEVASTGILTGACVNSDYIELFNRQPCKTDISGWILRDDGNATYIIPSNTTIEPLGFVLFCQTSLGYFGIGGQDTITLYNPSNVFVSTSGRLSGGGSSTSTFSRRTNGTFVYTKPSPNVENIFFSPLFGSIFVNEVAATPVAGVCAGQDYIEILNGNSTTAFSLAGFLLHDDGGPSSTDAYRFPSSNTSSLAPNEVRLLCGATTFTYGINPEDTITLVDTSGDLISTTGRMLNMATATSTYQLSGDRSGYVYGAPSPGASNAIILAEPKVVINEVADKAVPAGCNGTDYIELFNEGTSPADISNFRLRDDNPSNLAFIIPNNTIIPPLGYILFCERQFIYGIGGTDTITLFNASDIAVSTTGPLLDLGTTALTYSRRPNGSFAYTRPSPNAVNVFFSPFSSTVFVNEVANTGVTGVCAGQDWVEIINTGASAVNLSGFILHDDNGPNGTDAFLFPSNFTVLSAGEIRLLCGDSPGNFQFGIGGDDTITLIDVVRDLVSTTGKLLSLGTSTSTYQRTSNNTYQYATPTPGVANFVASGGKPVINEIAPIGTSATSVCGGGPYIEILNDAFAGLDLAGYVLSIGSTGNYTFPSGSNIASGALSVFCQNGTYSLAIKANDTVAIRDQTGSIVSSSGQIGGNNSRPNAVDLTWARVVDLINPLAPFTPFYQYSINPTPGRTNIFSFEPITLPRQPCGIQAAPLAPLSDYLFKELLTLNLGSRNPEFSGGTFDPRTCNNLVVGDEGNLNEIAIVNSTPSLLRTVPIIGGSTDTEGICFWFNELTGESKVVITDERDRSVAVCDIPTINQVVPLFRDSSNCRVLSLAQNQRNRTSGDPNEGFEGVVCDPVNNKLYVIQEKNPMLVWSVDVTSGIYSEMIDVQSLPSWTSRVLDLAGITYDKLTQSLYILSQESEVIVQSTLNGTIIGTTLSVAMMNAPEGLSFDPVTGDLIVVGEPNEIARFSKRLVTAPVTAPVAPPLTAPSPVAAPVVAPVKAPVTAPVAAPVKAPVTAPVAAPVKAPVTAPVAAPVAVPVAVPVNATAPSSDSPSSVTAAAIFTLSGVAGPLTSNTTVVFLKACGDFYQQTIPEALNVTCVLPSRRILRELQGNTTIVIQVNVIATFPPKSTASSGFTGTVVRLANEQPAVFVQILQKEAKSAGAENYYAAVVVKAEQGPTRSPTKTPTRIPTKSPTPPAPVATPVTAPVAAPVVAPAATPVAAPVKLPTDSPSQSPSVRPVKVPVKVPLALPVSFPVAAPLNAPVGTPISSPNTPVTPTAPAALPVTTPVAVPRAVPVTAPVTVPRAAPVKSPVVAPVPAAAPVVAPTDNTTKSPTNAPVRARCGLLGLSFLCPRSGNCGFFRRLFGIGGC